MEYQAGQPGRIIVARFNDGDDVLGGLETIARRENLRGVVLILDIRRIPSDEDIQMLQWLRACGIPPVIVVTKCDKLSKSQRAKQVAVISREINMEAGKLLLFSALSREGLDPIWTRIGALLNAGDEGSSNISPTP